MADSGFTDRFLTADETREIVRAGLASLSLALGLADVVQSHTGGIRLDTMFVDEGFGTLDPEALDLAMRALEDLQAGGRLVDRFALDHDLELAVLELAPVALQCRDVGLQGLELALLMGDPVPVHVVISPGLRLAMEGPKERVREQCEQLATELVKGGASSAACVFPGTVRRP